MIYKLPLFTFLCLSPLFVLLTLACTSTLSNNAISTNTNNSLPSVYINPQEQYPQDKFIVAVGVSTTLQEAQQNALSGLSQQINVKIKSSEQLSETLHESSSSEKEKTVQSTSMLQTNSSTHSTEEIQGVQYGSSFIEKSSGRTYSIAYLDRDAVSKIYTTQITNEKNKINTLMNNSKTTRNFKKYAIIIEAFELSTNLDSLFRQLQVISPNAADAINYDPQSTIDIALELQNTAQSIPIFSETIVQGANRSVQSKIQDEVTGLFSKMFFSISRGSTSTIPYIASTRITWEQRDIGDYVGIFWDFNLQIERNSQTVVSVSTQGQVKGADIDSATNLALHDIASYIHGSIRKEMLSQFK